MTKSVTIVNTSNWDGEDVLVSTDSREATTLKPGEQLVIGDHEYKSLHVSDAPEDGSSTFLMNGKQVFPFVSVGFRE